MNIRYLDEKESIDFLRSIIASKRNVPFIGTGFTYGEMAKTKTVPNGSDWMCIMRDQISSSPLTMKPTDEELHAYKFQELSDIYFQEDIVPLDQIKKTLDDCFTNVNISSPTKNAFLDLDWPYLYTLNIDDSIERALDAVKVLPYESFSKYKNRTCVYKMHGDVWTALKAKNRDDLKLIFGRADYIKSLKKNEYLIQALTNDLIESNLIFVGCSLTEEIDILFAISNLEGNAQQQSAKRVYVTSNEPKDFTTQKKLKDYGITDVIVCDYDNFYLKYIEISRDIISNTLIDSIFLFNEKPCPSFDIKKFFHYFVQADWAGGNPYNLPITRTIEQKVLTAIDTQPIIVIKGGRFSGRTSLLYAVLNKARTKQLFFVSSIRSLTDKELNELLAKKDSLIVFDTESLTWQQIKYICTKSDILQDRNVTMIIGINRWDVAAVDKLDSDEAIFDISDKFNSSEIDQINRIFDSVGIERWKNRDRLLDNIYHAAKTAVVTNLLSGTSALQRKIEDRVQYICSTRISQHEFSLIYFLAARQRIFSLHYRVILRADGNNLTHEECIENFIKVWTPFIEKTEADSVSSRATHSMSELTSNSQAWIYFALQLITLKIGYEETANKIVNTVAALKPIDNEYHELIMFDTLNAVFPSNARSLISKIYEKLAPLLSGEPDYWLQRAKSIYHNHLNNSEEDILVAIDYANKAIKESERRVTINARLTRANLYGLLCQVDEYKTESHILKAINMYSEAFDDYHKNSLYLDSMIERNKTDGYLKKLISQIDIMGKSLDFLSVKAKIDQLRGILSTQTKK